MLVNPGARSTGRTRDLTCVNEVIRSVRFKRYQARRKPIGYPVREFIEQIRREVIRQRVVIARQAPICRAIALPGNLEDSGHDI